jgi:hypothetical protein
MLDNAHLTESRQYVTANLRLIFDSRFTCGVRYPVIIRGFVSGFPAPDINVVANLVTDEDHT